MPHVELIYDLDCPNIRAARKILLEAFTEVGLRPSWTEWDRNSAGSPAHAGHYGSPTILVDGRDVAGAKPGEDANACRLYDHGPDGLRGIPAAQSIRSALAATSSSGAPTSVMNAPRLLASLPGVGAALLPLGFCPACWPAYAGVLGSLGLGFLMETTFLMPITVGLLAVALYALASGAKTRRGLGPLAVGIASAAAILVFKFARASDPLFYAGVFGLVAASVWNAWPAKASQAGSCPNCAPGQLATETEAAR